MQTELPTRIEPQTKAFKETREWSIDVYGVRRVGEKTGAARAGGPCKEGGEGQDMYVWPEAKGQRGEQEKKQENCFCCSFVLPVK